MKRIHVTVILCLLSFTLLAQVSKIENTRVNISTSLDSMIVKYNLTGKREANSVKLIVTDKSNRTIIPKNISGDVGDGIQPGNGKTIIWNMNADGVEPFGSSLKVGVKANIFTPIVKKKVWIPWLYIAAGASAITGTYAYLRADHLYKSYPPSSMTDEAERIHSDVDRMVTLSRVAFGAAAVLATAGVFVQIHHNKNKRGWTLNYLPQKNGQYVALTYKF